MLGGHVWDAQLMACSHDELLLHQPQVGGYDVPTSQTVEAQTFGYIWESLAAQEAHKAC